MDDNFLYQLREKPDPEFVKNLYRKLSQNHSELDRREKMNNHTFNILSSLLLMGYISIVFTVVAGSIELICKVVNRIKRNRLDKDCWEIVEKEEVESICNRY